MRVMTSRGGFELKGGDYSDWFSVWPRWGLQAYIELPSDWDGFERRRGCLVFTLIYGQFFIHFPWFKRYQDHSQCSGPKFGFSFFEDLLWIYHGNSTGSSKDRSSTTIYMPWHWRRCVHEVRNADGEWEPFVGSWERENGPWGEKKEPDGRVEETHDYTYELKSGEVQHCTATIFVERRTWTRFWYPWRMTRQCIDVDFSDEVGERSGSWKGGTVGCSYDMEPGETPLDTLRRMEREREF